MYVRFIAACSTHVVFFTKLAYLLRIERSFIAAAVGVQLNFFHVLGVYPTVANESSTPVSHVSRN